MFVQVNSIVLINKLHVRLGLSVQLCIHCFNRDWVDIYNFGKLAY